VLLRMTDSDGSLIAPNAFLPAAERFHFCSRIDKWVLRQVINALAELPDLNDIDTICVNLSGQSVGDRVFHRQAVEILGAAGGAICQRLCLEVTETAAITNMTEAALFINEVRLLGVRIALDDFGSGASSFGYLKSLSVDVLKIDGQFVRDVIEDPLDNAAVRCFVEVAAVVGVKTVAEFIDKPAVLERMKEFRVDYGQGFLLHLPEPLAKVLDQFARQLST
jgi:diguanylate cyclase